MNTRNKVTDESCCARCQAPNPEGISGSVPTDWESLIDESGTVMGVICEGCSTPDEQHAIDDEMIMLGRQRQQHSGGAMTVPNAAPREGLPWMPEEDLLLLAERPSPPRTWEAYEAIKSLRYAAISVVTAHASGEPICEAVAELEAALLAGVEPDE